MIRIAYVIPQIQHDPNTTPYQRLKGLSSKNFLYVFTGKQTSFPDFVEKGNLKLIRAPINFGPRFLYPIWCTYKVLILNRKLHFHLVYSSFHFYSYFTGCLLKSLGHRWVIDLWDSPELGIEVWKMSRKRVKGLINDVFRLVAFQVLKRMLRKADLVISVIHTSALRGFRIDKRKVFAVTNGVDFSITEPKGLKQNLPNFTVFYVGDVMRDRGLGLLLNVAKILREKIGNFELILVGDAPKDDINFIREFNLKEVRCLGRLKHKEVLSIMERSDICIFPFPKKKVLDCIYPVKVFEYMAMGKAIVATRLTGVSEVLENGVNGLLVEPDDPRKMAAAIFEIYRDPNLRERLEVNARKAAIKYDWRIINEKINEKISDFVGEEL